MRMLEMELKKQSWITLLILSIAEGAVISTIQNTSSYLIPCEHGWYLFGDTCYALFGKTKGLHWKAAEVSCGLKNGSLVTIQNQEIQDFLTTFLLLDVKSSAWIGLNDREGESNFTWVDGSAANYTYWGPREPSNVNKYSTGVVLYSRGRSSQYSMGGFASDYEFRQSRMSPFITDYREDYIRADNTRAEEDCVQMLYTDKCKMGMWSDATCDYANLPFICQKNKSEQSMNSDLRFCTGKNEGAWRYMNSCYHTVSEEMSWDDAENYCQTVLDGHLLTIIDYDAELFINYVLSKSDFNREFWIGIKIRDSGHQMWSSAWVVSYKKWEPEHEHFINGTCGYMTEKWLWSSAPCFRKLPFVCEVPLVKPPPLKQAPEGWKCPESSQDWIDVGGDTCYIFETSKPKIWHEANFACAKKGGHLASISSVAETNAIHPYVLGKTPRMLIGLHRSLSNNSVFEWADGTVLDFQNWVHGEPNNPDEACGEVWTEGMIWNDIPCNTRRSYMCSAKKVPPYLFGSNESYLIDSQQLVKRNCSGDGSSNAIVTVLFVAVIVILVAVFTIYVYKNHFRKNSYQGLKYFAMSFSAKNRPESSDFTQEEPIYQK